MLGWETRARGWAVRGRALGSFCPVSRMEEARRWMSVVLRSCRWEHDFHLCLSAILFTVATGLSCERLLRCSHAEVALMLAALRGATQSPLGHRNLLRPPQGARLQSGHLPRQSCARGPRQGAWVRSWHRGRLSLALLVPAACLLVLLHPRLPGHPQAA